MTPVDYIEEWRAPGDLELGWSDGGPLHFYWRPYAQRSQAAREDYDRLVVSVFHRGVRRPVIAWGRNVLVGQRRVEIAARLRTISTVCVWRITEDVSQWGGDDLPRLQALAYKAGITAY